MMGDKPEKQLSFFYQILIKDYWHVFLGVDQHSVLNWGKHFLFFFFFLTSLLCPKINSAQLSVLHSFCDLSVTIYVSAYSLEVLAFILCW